MKGENEVEKRQLVIIGAGPAGLTAAIYGKRAGLDVLLLEKGVPGGQINITDEIENWTGVEHASGPELAESFRKHAMKFGTEFRDTSVRKVALRDGIKIVATEDGDIEAEAVILATGASYKKMDCPGEAEFTGRGVSYCAVCDGAFFEGETIAVVGGGNSAVEEACYLTQFAEKVYIVHRRDSFRADRVAVEKALSNPKIQPVWNSVVEAVAGNEMVEKLVLRNVKTGEKSDLPVAGVFVFVGTVPNDEPLKGVVAVNRNGWIETNDRMETSVEGIFAAGDVRDKFLRQVITAASDGAVAAMAAYGYISEQLHLRSTLLDPDHVVALFTSSVAEPQVRLAGAVEEWSAASGKKVTLVDGYKNARMVERLNLDALPVLVELRQGTVVRRQSVGSLEDVQRFC